MKTQIILTLCTLSLLAACSAGASKAQFSQLEARVQKLEQDSQAGGVGFQTAKIKEFDRLIKKQAKSNTANHLNYLQQIENLQADIQTITEDQELNAREISILTRKNQALEQQLKK